jgi:hypothetical protein
MECIILLGRGMPRNEQTDTLAIVREHLLRVDSDRRIEIAFLEMTPPGLPETLELLDREDVDRAVIVSMFIPYDRNVKAWLPRVIQRGLNEGRWSINVVFAAPLEDANAYAAAVEAAVKAARTLPDKTDIRPMRKRPNNSRIPPHTRHVFVCVGPRCVEAGGWAVLDALRRSIAAHGLDKDPNRVLCSRSACQDPCIWPL